MPPEDPDGAPDGNPYVDGRARTLRDATAGPLFGERYRPDDAGVDAGLIAGSTNDPVLVAGVGYPLLGDLAVGTIIAYSVADWELPDVAVADCSHTPVAAYQTITAGDHEAVVLVGAEKRCGELNDGIPSESPGAIHEYGAGGYEVPDDDIVDRIGESAMGSNTVENVLAVGEALGGFPEDTRAVTVEPAYDSWGMNVEELTDPVEDALDEVLDRVLARIENVTSGP